MGNQHQNYWVLPPPSLMNQHTGLCRAHGIPHTRVTAADALPTALSNAWALNGHSVVEVVTDRQHNVAQHRALQTAVRGAVDVALQQWMASNAGSAQGLYDLVPGPAAVTPGTWRIEAVDLCMYAVPVSGRLTTGDLILHRKGCLLRLTLTNGQGRCRGVGDCAPLSGARPVWVIVCFCMFLLIIVPCCASPVFLHQSVVWNTRDDWKKP